MPSLINLAGSRFGRLVVIGRSARTGKDTYWDCKCDCGNETSVMRGSLKLGDTRSCGCLKNEETGNRFRKWPSEESALRARYSEYILNARKRDIEFNISFQDFSGLCSSDCYYCGSSPVSRPSSRKYKNGKTNGIDRIDSEIGYIVENCRPCCSWCNRSKGRMSDIEFVNRCFAVAAHAAVGVSYAA